MQHLTFHSVLRSVPIGCALTALALSPAMRGTGAQDAPVAFNAGFFSQGTAWSQTASYLGQRLFIETLTPSHGWDRPFSEQGANYGAAMTAWGRSAVIGLSHSNGGIASRTSVHVDGAATRLNRLTTIGSPHQGATIAANMLNGRVVNYMGNLAGSLLYAADFYANNDPAWNVNPVIDYVTQNAFGYMHNFAMHLTRNDALIGLGIAVALPATIDVSPGSGFMQQYNSSAHLATESSVLSKRVGVSTQAHPDGALFRLASSDPAAWRRVQAITAAGALLLYSHYANHPDWWLAAHADYWLQAYWYVKLLDVAWQDFIGALVSYNGYYMVVAASDAFIPHWSSQYPGATAQYNLNLPIYNIVHTEQINHPAMRARYETLLIDDFNVSPRPSPPPSPPNPPPCTLTGTEIICN